MASLRARASAGRHQARHVGVGGHLPLTADAGRDDRLARGHGFQQGDGKAFAQAGQDHQVAGREQIAYVLAKTEKPHPVRHTQMAGQLLQTVALPARHRR